VWRPSLRPPGYGGQAKNGIKCSTTRSMHVVLTLRLHPSSITPSRTALSILSSKAQHLPAGNSKGHEFQGTDPVGRPGRRSSESPRWLRHNTRGGHRPTPFVVLFSPVSGILPEHKDRGGGWGSDICVGSVGGISEDLVKIRVHRQKVRMGPH
jgi:hypothetical protein